MRRSQWSIVMSMRILVVSLPGRLVMPAREVGRPEGL